ncbi:MAG TPA: molybdate ABC transporter substrate-binding protein [Jiangellaceae bacterium]
MHCKRAAALLAGAVVALGSAACSDTADPDRVTVLAAASLTEPFTMLADEISDDDDEISDDDIALSFAASSALVEQLRAGAPADVLATADTRTMALAVDAGLVTGDPVVFASNSLVLAVPAGNPGNVAGLADLSRDELRVALCEPQVPCGAAAEQMLATAGVDARPDTLESDARDTAGKLALGEVDAALIYRTDVTSAMEIVDVPPDAEVVTEYLIAMVDEAPNPRGAEEFITAVTGIDGRRLLVDAGFESP